MKRDRANHGNMTKEKTWRKGRKSKLRGVTKMLYGNAKKTEMTERESGFAFERGQAKKKDAPIVEGCGQEG